MSAASSHLAGLVRANEQIATLRAQLEAAEAANDRLTGMKFSDRMHAALVSRAEAAEANAARYEWLQTQTPYQFKKIQDASMSGRDDDVIYFFKDRFDSLVDAARTKEETK